MFDLKKALAEWKRSLRRLESLEDGAIAELESHLLDEFDKQKRSGLAAEEAFAMAAAAVGRPEDVGGEYFKDSRRSRLASPSWQKSRFSAGLFLHQLKIYFRKSFRLKGQSLINTLSLAIGLACCLAIFLYVGSELSVDRYHKDYKRIFRIGLEITGSTGRHRYAINAPPLAPRLNRNFLGVQNAARLFFPDSVGRRLLKKGKEVFFEEGFVYADPEIFSILSYSFIEGSPAQALRSPKTVVIPRHLAEKYFPHESALGKTLNINHTDTMVSGVIENPPPNSHLPRIVFQPISDLGNPGWLEDWTWPGMLTYVKLSAGADPKAVETRIGHTCSAFYRGDPKAQGQRFHHFLQPLTDIYLHSGDLEYAFQLSGNRTNLLIFPAIGLIVLLIACINFTNLATARAASRAKEIGIRKVAGAKRSELIAQFISEAWLTALQAILLALVLLIVGRPLLAQMTGFTLDIGSFGNPRTLLAMLALSAVVAVLSGGYPAFHLSSVKPTAMIKGGGSGSARSVLRRTLVVIQFAVSVALSIITFIVFQQVRFMRGKDLGIQKEKKIVLQIHREKGRPIDWEALKNAFSRQAGIRASASENPPGWGAGSLWTRLLGKGESKDQMMCFFSFDADFPHVYGMEMAAGRPFNKKKPTDAAGSCLINEAAVKAFGWESPHEALGKQIESSMHAGAKTIIGVVKDFHYRSIQFLIEPLFMEISPQQFRCLTLDLNTGDIPRTLAFIKDTWHRQFPNLPFDYTFLDSSLAQLYQDEEKTGQLITLFTVLGIFIACLGLLGLAAFTAQQRTKEIGIRKTLGASTAAVVVMLMKDFTTWVSAGALVAFPLAFWLARQWLQEFPYRIDIGWQPFAASFFLALIISSSTVLFQSVRAARANPVDSLKYE